MSTPDKIPMVGGYERDAGYVRYWRELYTCYARIIGPAPLALWAFLRDHVHRKQDAGGGLTWVGHRLIMATFDISRNTAKEYINRLVRVGLVVKRPATVAVKNKRDRVELHIDDRAVVYEVLDVPAAAEFAAITFGRYCRDCPFVARCEPGREAAGLEKIPGIHVERKGTPKPVSKIDTPSHQNLTPNNTTIVVCSDLAERMKALGVGAKMQSKLIKSYGEPYVRQKIDLCESQLDVIEKPAAWLVAACRDDYLPPCTGGERKAKTRGRAGKRADPVQPEILKVYR